MRRLNTLLSYTFSHFCVDFACFYVAYSYIYANFSLQTCTAFFFAYNVLAFGLQGIIGYFCDTHENFPAGICGGTIVALSLFLSFSPPLAIIIAGIGNAFFHVGGGIDSLKNAEGKMARSGVFVSAGALGVTLGTIYGMGDFSVALPLILIVVSLVLMFVFAESKSAKTKTANLKLSYEKFNFGNNKSFTAVISLACGTIFVRCFAGYEIPLGWYDNTILILAIAYGGSAVIGKACGGFLADRFGGKEVGVSLLVLSIPFLMFGNNNIVISLVGVCLFNTSMPITLCLIYSKLHKNAGLAFGITTLALLVGTFPAMFGISALIDIAIVLPICIVLSAVCLYSACGKREKN